MSSASASVFGSYSDVMGHPAFEVQIGLASGGTVGFYVVAPSGNGLDVNGNAVGYALVTSATEASLLSALKTWIDGYDWAADPAIGSAVSSVTITKIDQSQTDVTPS